MTTTVGGADGSPRGFRTYQDAEVAPLRSIVAAVSGPEKAGKSQFCLETGPGDAYLLAMDANSIPTALKVLHKLRRERGSAARQIHINDFTYERNVGVGEGVKRWARFKDSYYDALAVGVGTLVVDTETIMYAMAQLAIVGTEGQVRMNAGARMEKFGQLNGEYLGMLAAARRSGMSVLFIQKMGKVYITITTDKGSNSEWNGEWEAKGWGDLKYEVGSNLSLSFDPDRIGSAESPFLLYVTNHGPNMELAGTWFNRGAPENCDFNMLLNLTYGWQ